MRTRSDGSVHLQRVGWLGMKPGVTSAEGTGEPRAGAAPGCSPSGHKGYVSLLSFFVSEALRERAAS